MLFEAFHGGFLFGREFKDEPDEGVAAAGNVYPADPA
jgi:hypothetical protein